MDHRSRLFVGGILIVIGVLALVGAILHINFWELCWPAGLISLGLLLLIRPRWIIPGSPMRFFPVGDITRSGQWQVQPETFSTFVSDIELDFTTTTLPAGETSFQADGFVIGCKVRLPAGVGIRVSSNAFTTDAKFLDQKAEAFMTTFTKTSPDYDSAASKIDLVLNGFVIDLTVERAGMSASTNTSLGGLS